LKEESPRGFAEVKNERPQKRKMDENGRGGERKEGKKGRRNHQSR
jgi:hypothetical protein